MNRQFILPLSSIPIIHASDGAAVIPAVASFKNDIVGAECRDVDHLGRAFQVKVVNVAQAPAIGKDLVPVAARDDDKTFSTQSFACGTIFSCENIEHSIPNVK